MLPLVLLGTGLLQFAIHGFVAWSGGQIASKARSRPGGRARAAR